MAYATKRGIKREASASVRRRRGPHSKGYKNKGKHRRLFPTQMTSVFHRYVVDDGILREITLDEDLPEGTETVVYDEAQMRGIGQIIAAKPNCPLGFLAQECYDLSKGMMLADASTGLAEIAKKRQTNLRALLLDDNTSSEDRERIEAELSAELPTVDATRVPAAQELDQGIKTAMDEFGVLPEVNDEVLAMLAQFGDTTDPIAKAQLQGQLEACAPRALELYAIVRSQQDIISAEGLYRELGYPTFPRYMATLALYGGSQTEGEVINVEA
jgi:hypothetical protein